jgi:hypothetical protein
MKIFKTVVLTIYLTIMVPSIYGQVIDMKIIKTKADTSQLEIRNSKEISNLVTYEELDIHRYGVQMNDSSGVSKPSSYPVIKKIRLDADEIKAKLPMVVYEYPDGALEIDYDALIAILLVRCNENSEMIKILQDEVEALKSKTKTTK